MPAFMGILEMKNTITVAQLTGPSVSHHEGGKSGSFPSPESTGLSLKLKTQTGIIKHGFHEMSNSPY